MGMIFATHSGVDADAVCYETDLGGSTCYHIQRCLGLVPSNGGQLLFEEFSQKINAAIEDWGPDSPGYPDILYIRDYGRGPEYILSWLERIRDETVSPGLDDGDRFVLWF